MWKPKKKPRIKELHESTLQASDKLNNQKSEVNAIGKYLDQRKNQNGFGDMFEYTLRPRRN